MKNIVLCCAAGMSTSMLVQRMKDAAQKKGVEVDIKAVPVAEFKDIIGTADIVLMDYGMMKGDVVLDKALKMLEQ